jgi:hypothetical protein
MTVLTAVQAAAPLVSLQPPSQLFGSSQETQILLRTLANRELTELARRHDWPQLLAEHTFLTSGVELQSGGFASDLDRIIEDTFWNRDTDWRVVGPLTPQEWAYHKTQGLTSAVVHMWMRRGNELYMYPAPGANQTLAYEYIRNTPALDSTSVPKAAFTADTDVCRLPEELITLGVVWRYLQQKGMDYAEALKTYELRVQSEINATRSKRKMNIVPGSTFRGKDIVPEGDWTL